MAANNCQASLVGEIRGVGTLVDDNLTGQETRQPQLRAVDRRLSDRGRLLRPPLESVRDDLFAVLPTLRFQTYRAALSPLNIKTNSEIIGLSLRQPIYRTVTDEVALSIIGEHLFTQSFLLISDTRS